MRAALTPQVPGGIPMTAMNDSRLDKVFDHSYIAALVFVVLALWAAPAVAGGTSAARGAQLPPGCTQVGEDRYRSPSKYDDVLKWFDKQYKTNPRKPIVNQPGIRAKHIVNDSRAGDWEGLNVYELEGETRIFVKIANRSGQWGFFMRFTDADGNPLDGLTFEPAIDSM